MNTRTTIVLLVLVIVAALLYFFAEPFRPPGEGAGQDRLIAGFDRKGVAEIEVVRGADRFVFHRRSENEDIWDLTEPVHAEADDEGVRQILSALEYNQSLTLAMKGDPDPANYGLDNPRAVVHARAGERTWEVAVGAEDPVGNHVYARCGAQGSIVRTGENLWTAVSKSLDDFREHNLLRTRSWEVTRLEIQGEDRVLELRREEGRWRIMKPLSLRADSAKIDPLLGDLVAIRAETFVEDDPASLEPYGLEAPRWRVTLGTKSGELEILLVGNPGPESGQVYAMRGGGKTVSLVDDGFLSSLDPSPEVFRSTQVVEALAESAREIRVRRGESIVWKAHREDLAWHLDEPESRPAEGDAVREWLRHLETLEITRFVEDAPEDLAPYGLTDGLTKVEVARGEEEGDLVGITIGRDDPDAGGTYLKRDDENAVCLVPTESLAFVLQPAWKLRDKSLLEIDAASIARIRVVSGEAAVAFVPQMRETKRVWVREEGGEAEAEEAGEGEDAGAKAVEDLVFDLIDLVADHWVAEGDVEGSRLDEPRVTLEVERAAKEPAPDESSEEEASGDTTPRPFRLAIGARGKDDARWYFARVEGDAVVCAVRKALVDTLLRVVGREPDPLDTSAAAPEEPEESPPEESAPEGSARDEGTAEDAGGAEAAAAAASPGG